MATSKPVEIYSAPPHYSDRALRKCASIDDIEALARRRTPLPVIDFIAAGSGTEDALRRNRSAFSDYRLRPRVSRNVAEIDPSIQFFGRKLALPLAIAPIGSFGMVRKDAELAAARAAGAAGILYCLSCNSTASLEEVAKACCGPKVFQIYALADQGFTIELIDRAKAAGYDALCLTVDAQGFAGRPRANRWGIDRTFAKGKWPPLRTILSTARFPRRAFVLRQQMKKGTTDIMKTLRKRGQQLGVRNDLEWNDWREFAQRWGGPFLIKGVLRGDDAQKAAGLGPAAVVVCNHGGTFVDSAVASIDAVEEVVAALPPMIPAIQCGGIRSGLHLLTSLALGAKVGMTGRPFLFGAAAAGEEGVTRVIDIFKEEFATAMRMTGCRTIADIDKSLIRAPGMSREPVENTSSRASPLGTR